VQWSDLSWYTEAQAALDEGDLKSAQAYAEAYWAGDAFPIASQRVPEGRCCALRVCEVVEEPDPETVLVEGVSVMHFLKDRLPLPEPVIEQLLATDLETLIDRAKGSEHATRNPDLEDGTVGIWGYGSAEDFSVVSLETFSGDQLHSTVSNEAVDCIKKHPSYAHYVELTLSGSSPPPIHACQSHDGRMTSANRRRLLVAQETNTPIRAWVERLNQDTTVVTYGQVQDALSDFCDAVKVSSAGPSALDSPARPDLSYPDATP
jgi:hypothetical protein